ncbi:MAG: flagellar assembly protein FliH [Succinivibrionaceae bacterium]|nr:flagellar assembly protein FliH [Succinivibrionaceae bacterium]
MSDLVPDVVLDLEDSTKSQEKAQRTDERYLRPIVNTIKAEDEAAKEFAPLQWPMMDDGVKAHTTAIGSPTGGWYQRQLRLSLERKAEEERQEMEREMAEAEAPADPAPGAEGAEAGDSGQAAGAPTVQNLEEIAAAAEREGYEAGLAKGHEEGFAKGYEEGVAQGQGAGAKQGYEEGLAQGREEGFSQGQEEGLANGERIVLEQAERFRHLADELSTPLRELNREVTDELVYLVSRLASVIIRREIKGDHEFLAKTIREAVAVLPKGQKGATVSLHPDDIALLEAAIGAEYIKEQRWQLVPDEQLAPGSVMVTDLTSTVNWRLDDRIDSLLNSFLEGAAGIVDRALRDEVGDEPPSPPPSPSVGPAMAEAQPPAPGEGDPVPPAGDGAPENPDPAPQEAQ